MPTITYDIVSLKTHERLFSAIVDIKPCRFGIEFMDAITDGAPSLLRKKFPGTVPVLDMTTVVVPAAFPGDEEIDKALEAIGFGRTK